MGRKVYDCQFKMADVQLMLEENLLVKDVAKKLSIHPNTLYRWINMKNNVRKVYLCERKSNLKTIYDRL
ncbi:transposase [Priestia megaterium]|uniref:transposase n=1 Tax=Priestia megaterium TaxID=1404 RepID=UPI00159C37EB